MRTNLFIFTLAFLGTGLVAQTSGDRDSRYLPSDTFTEFIGLEVRNMHNKKLGRVKYITHDLQNARIAEVVIQSGGGFLGIGSKSYAVAPRVLTLDTPAKCLRMNSTPSALRQAPRFDNSHMEADTARGQIANVTRHFGLEPWFYEEGETTSKNKETLRLGPIVHTQQIIGLPVTSTSGDYMGHVDTLRMDLPKGQIIHVVTRNRSDSVPDSVVQPRALRFNAGRTGLTYDTSNVNLDDEPRFKWLNSRRTSYKEEQYVNRDKTSEAMDQGANFRDRQKTSRILSAIRTDSRLSASARNIQVVTQNAQTTLRGRVGSAAEKRILGEIAVQAGRLENVSNQIEVR